MFKYLQTDGTFDEHFMERGQSFLDWKHVFID